MSPLRTTFLALAAAAVVSGCATPAAAPAGAAPAQAHPARVLADELYRLGRYLQGQRRDELALAAHAQAQAALPGHVPSLNAIGVLRARRGEGALAEQAFRAALQQDPQAPVTLNNLAFLLLEQGRPGEALPLLERAQLQTPADAVVIANLARARSALASQASAAAAAPAPGDGAAAAAAAEPGPGMQPTVEVARIGEAVFELRNLPASTPAASTPAAAPSELPRIEIANGHGARGLARSIAQSLPGAPHVRLTNHRPFGAEHSRIEYLPGAEQAARAVGAQLPEPVPLQQVPRLARDARVRLLLGKDFPAHAPAAQHAARP